MEALWRDDPRRVFRFLDGLLEDIDSSGRKFAPPWRDRALEPDERLRHAVVAGGVVSDQGEAEEFVVELLRQNPDLIRGMGTIESAAKGGEAARKPVTNEELRAELQAVRRRSIRVSWTDACERVGSRHGLSGRQVRRRVPETRWTIAATKGSSAESVGDLTA